MAALVVFESMFGSTEAVARAVAEGIASRMPVSVVEVGQAPDPGRAGVELLVVGAPTHAFGLSRQSTRDDAAKQAGHPVISSGRGVREWFDHASSCSLPAAAFDTHVSRPDLPGHAGRRVQRRLKSLGCRLVTGAESFAVGGTQGPLGSGELDRARAWGAEVAAAAQLLSTRA